MSGLVENYEKLSLKKTMNSFSSVTTSIAVALILIVSPTFTFGLASKKPCNLTNEYRIMDKDNVSKFLLCYPCDDCEAGKELLYPCGTDVRDNVSLGHKCKTCRAGTYSTGKNSRPCQDCPDAKCAKHEMIICNQKTGRNSHCTGKCKDGYVWSKDKTECIMYVLPTKKASTQKSTTQKSGDSEMHNTTTKPDKDTPNTKPDREHTQNTTKKPILEVIKPHHNQMSTYKILAIIFGCILSLMALITCWYLIKRFRQRRPQEDQNHVNKCLSRLMVETKKFTKKAVNSAPDDSVNSSDITYSAPPTQVDAPVPGSPECMEPLLQPVPVDRSPPAPPPTAPPPTAPPPTAPPPVATQNTSQNVTINVEICRNCNVVTNDSPVQTNGADLLGGSDPISESMNKANLVKQNTSNRLDDQSSQDELLFNFHKEEQSPGMTKTPQTVKLSSTNPVQCTSSHSQENFHSQEHGQGTGPS